MIGQIISNYKIISVIDEGGMGTVYLAQHIHIGRKVAIKSLHKRLLLNHNIRERFKYEAATLSQIEHPNIVKLYDYLETKEGFYLIMEYVDGVTLDKFIKKESGPIREDNAIRIMNSLLSAFSYAHSKNIVHRDVKPSNVIINRDFSIVKILDFGIAKIIGTDSKNLTKDGTQMGTVYYMSPEQVKGLTLDKRSDIYSLGMTLYQMVTGINPYEYLTSEYEIYNRITQAELPDAKSVYPYVSAKIVSVIKKAMRKDPKDRYQNCQEMIDELTDENKKIHVNSKSLKLLDTSQSHKKPIKIILIVGACSIVFFSILIALIQGNVRNKTIQVYDKWEKAEVRYSDVDTLSIKSDTSIKNNTIAYLTFGDSIKILKNGAASSLVEGLHNGKEGFIDSNNLINREDLMLLTKILNNDSVKIDSVKKEIRLSKYRKSLLEFYKNKNLDPATNVIIMNTTNEIKKKKSKRKTDYCIVTVKNLNTHLLKAIIFVYDNDSEVVNTQVFGDFKKSDNLYRIREQIATILKPFT